jgi:hypothetical protein
LAIVRLNIRQCVAQPNWVGFTRGVLIPMRLRDSSYNWAFDLA